MNLRKAFTPILLFFGLVNIVLMIAASWVGKLGIDADVMMVANLFVCLLTLFSFWMLHKGLRAKSTTSFLTAVYGSFLAKLILAAVAVVVYATVAGDDMNKPAVFAAMVLYLVYMFLEIRGLLMVVKKS
jgi:hypothetical protein